MERHPPQLLLPAIRSINCSNFRKNRPGCSMNHNPFCYNGQTRRHISQPLVAVLPESLCLQPRLVARNYDLRPRQPHLVVAPSCRNNCKAAMPLLRNICLSVSSRHSINIRILITTAESGCPSRLPCCSARGWCLARISFSCVHRHRRCGTSASRRPGRSCRAPTG